MIAPPRSLSNRIVDAMVRPLAGNDPLQSHVPMSGFSASTGAGSAPAATGAATQSNKAIATALRLTSYLHVGVFRRVCATRTAGLPPAETTLKCNRRGPPRRSYGRIHPQGLSPTEILWLILRR